MTTTFHICEARLQCGRRYCTVSTGPSHCGTTALLQVLCDIRVFRQLTKGLAYEMNERNMTRAKIGRSDIETVRWKVLARQASREDCEANTVVKAISSQRRGYVTANCQMQVTVSLPRSAGPRK